MTQLWQHDLLKAQGGVTFLLIFYVIVPHITDIVECAHPSNPDDNCTCLCPEGYTANGQRGVKACLL